MIQTPQTPGQVRTHLENKGDDKYTTDTCDSDEDTFLMIFNFQTSLVKNSILFGNLNDTSVGGGGIEKPL